MNDLTAEELADKLQHGCANTPMPGGLGTYGQQAARMLREHKQRESDLMQDCIASDGRVLELEQEIERLRMNKQSADRLVAEVEKENERLRARIEEQNEYIGTERDLDFIIARAVDKKNQEIERLRAELRLESKRLRQCQDGYAVMLEETDKLRAATKRCAVRPYCACQHADGEGCDTCLAWEALGDDDG